MLLNSPETNTPLFAPPLPLPLKLIDRAPRLYFKSQALFGSMRTAADVAGPAHEGEETKVKVYRPHEGLDFRAVAGTPVLAARPGTVVAVDQLLRKNPDWDPESGDEVDEYIRDAENKKIVIRHIKEQGKAFTTRYLHVNPLVEVGDSVEYGHKIAEVGDVPDMGHHLHFEVHLMMTDSPRGAENWYRRQTEKADPIPYLYPWEKIYFEEIAPARDRTLDRISGNITRIEVKRFSGVPMFVVRIHTEGIFLPLPYIDVGDKEMISVIKSAFLNGLRVELMHRPSIFFSWDKGLLCGAIVHSEADLPSGYYTPTVKS